MYNKLEDYLLKDFVEKTKDKTSYPGGGAITALSASLGASLIIMAEELSKDSSLRDSKFVLQIGEELLQNMEDDALAYEQVIQGQKLPKNTEKEKEFRNQKIQEGLVHAIEVPLNTARKSLALLKYQSYTIEEISSYAISDTGVSALLLYGAIEGALLNGRINIISLKDQELRKKYLKEMDEILNQGHKLKEEILEKVYGKL
ncbi:MAG: cyclodeaminase/cyclohydrolase family protein [Tissierellia bacterium]|nr:cyclodeaminase/cyclohydrolase family protein [Tissierellia bacterium]